MAGKAKFLFDHPFDGAKPKASSEAMYRPKGPPPKFSLDDLEAAKKQAFDEGEQAGRHSAEADHARNVEQALAAIEARLAQLAEGQNQAQAAARAEAVSAAWA